MKLAIYSGYTGMGYVRKIQKAPSEKYPCYFISNNIAIRSHVARLGWIPVEMDVPLHTTNLVESTRQSKIFKMLPSTFKELQEYDYLYYSDDKLKINDEKMQENVDVLGDGAYALLKHFYNPPNILHEFIESLSQPRYVEVYKQLVTFIANEVDNGLKLNSDLYATGVILRNMRHKETQNMDNYWYETTQISGGLQCQISFFFMAQKFKEFIRTLPENAFEGVLA